MKFKTGFSIANSSCIAYGLSTKLGEEVQYPVAKCGTKEQRVKFSNHHCGWDWIECEAGVNSSKCFIKLPEKNTLQIHYVTAGGRVWRKLVVRTNLYRVTSQQFVPINGLSRPTLYRSYCITISVFTGGMWNKRVSLYLQSMGELTGLCSSLKELI